MPGAYMTCTAMSLNGVPIGSERLIIVKVRAIILRGRPPVPRASLAAATVSTISPSRARLTAGGTDPAGATAIPNKLDSGLLRPEISEEAK